MLLNDASPSETRVALLAEGVDRNWKRMHEEARDTVALLAEGVDRNTLTWNQEYVPGSRPPRGGRG